MNFPAAGFTNLDEAKETSQSCRSPQQLLNREVLLAMVVHSCCPMVLKATRQQNLGARAGCELRCREAVLSAGLANLEGPQPRSYWPPYCCFFSGIAENDAGVLI